PERWLRIARPSARSHARLNRVFPRLIHTPPPGPLLHLEGPLHEVGTGVADSSWPKRGHSLGIESKLAATGLSSGLSSWLFPFGGRKESWTPDMFCTYPSSLLRK